MSGSGGDNFSGSGGNGLVELSSNPGSKAATFGVKFKGLTDGTSEVTVSSCTITVNGKEIDALSGVSLEEEEEEKADASAEDEEEEEDDEDRATWVIDGRTFLTHHIPGIDGYDDEKIEIQGKQVRVLHNTVTDVYLVYLFSDNGSYRDYFVYNPDTGNIVPYIEKQSGTDTVTFIEPEEGGYVPIRYSYVDMPWGAKYTVPAYKHVIIDGVDEIFDDTNRYLSMVSTRMAKKRGTAMTMIRIPCSYLMMWLTRVSRIILPSWRIRMQPFVQRQTISRTAIPLIWDVV